MSDSSTDLTRRIQILRAAERLLKHYGFSKTTVSDIAAEAGVGVGTVYLEFSSKNDIIGALAQERHERILAATQAALSANGSYSDRLRELLDARIEALFEFAAEGQHGADLISCACPAVDQIKAKYRSTEEVLLSRFLAAADDAGEFSVPAPQQTVRIILRVYDGFAPTLGCSHSLDEIRDELRATHSLLLDGLRRR